MVAGARVHQETPFGSRAPAVYCTTPRVG